MVKKNKISSNEILSFRTWNSIRIKYDRTPLKTYNINKNFAINLSNYINKVFEDGNIQQIANYIMTSERMNNAIVNDIGNKVYNRLNQIIYFNRKNKDGSKAPSMYDVIQSGFNRIMYESEEYGEKWDYELSEEIPEIEVF